MTNNLPTSWQIKTLDEVCVSTNSNITFKNIQDKKGDYPIYGASGVVAYVDFYTKENQSLGIVKDGAGIGRVFLLPPKVSVIGTLHYVENNDDLNLKYLFYFLQSINLARYITGSAIPHIYFRDWKKEQIPLPPLEIQKRIVARLESAFEKIEKGSAHLQNAKTKLAKYKQSLLKSAFNGTLFCHTEGEARSISNQESRDISLAMTDKENPKLPQGWTIKTLGEVCEKISAGGDKPNDCTAEKTQENQIPIFSNGVENNGLYGYTKTPTITKPALTISARGTIGFVCVRYEPFFPIVRLISAIPNDKILVLEFLAYALRYLIPQGEGSSIPQLTIPNFKQIKIPLPPLETQKQIVKLLEKHLQHADKTGKFIESALNKAKQLKQSLLKSAFLGKLT